MIYQEFCEYFGIKDRGEVKPPPGPSLDIRDLPGSDIDEVVLHVCPVQRDDAAMRQRLDRPATERVSAYDALRSHYPARRDFGAWTLSGFANDPSRETLCQMGFSATSH
jgi:erythronate-4-phosphate dehydrogenase